MDKQLCIRFDVDTPVCATEGVPALLKLATAENTLFTFFYNMGKSISWPAVISSRTTSKHEHSIEKQKLGAVRKLGLQGLLKTLALNPNVGKSTPEIICNANAEGHEIGLHGGRNHSSWHHMASLWNEEKIQDEISWGLNALQSIGINTTDSFASPGWTSPKLLSQVLAKFDFKILCDIYGPDIPMTHSDKSTGITNIVTNLVGPGGVGYLEYCAASCNSAVEINHKFRTDLQNISSLGVMYDHPCFAGRHGLELLKQFISTAKELGFRFTTIRAAANGQ